MEALGINLGYLIMQILIITILLLLMRGLVYKPLLRILDERKARIAKGLEDSRQAAIARDNADAEAKKILDSARQEAAKIRQEAVAQADETAKGIEAKANEEARGIVAAAILVYGFLIGFVMTPNLGNMLVPVVAYLLVIVVMVVLAALGRVNHWLVVVGACLFIASDSLIAVNRFITPVPSSSFLIMATYYPAQLLITAGAARNR